MDEDCIEGRNEDDKMDRWIYMVLHSNTPYHRDKSYRSLMILSPVHIRSGQHVRAKTIAIFGYERLHTVF